jgi:hypothetical protein
MSDRPSRGDYSSTPGPSSGRGFNVVRAHMREAEQQGGSSHTTRIGDSSFLGTSL